MAQLMFVLQEEYFRELIMCLSGFFPQIFATLEVCSQCKASLALTPELSHIIYLVMILLVLHVADRQVK